MSSNPAAAARASMPGLATSSAGSTRRIIVRTASTDLSGAIIAGKAPIRAAAAASIGMS